MEIIPGYWVCSCGYFNYDSLTWCVECVKERGKDYIPPSVIHEGIAESRTAKDNA